MLISIKRVCSRPDGTFGVLLVDDVPVCVTLELPWRNNERRVSCIPAGIYAAKALSSPKFGDTYWLQDVPNRSEILIHGAGTIDDLLGCIGLGEFYHDWGSKMGIANPYKGAAMEEFRKRTNRTPVVSVEITEHF